MSWTITASVLDRLVTSARASMLGWKPSTSAARLTRSRVWSLTGCDEPESTRDTVATETPATLAISVRDAKAHPIV